MAYTLHPFPDNPASHGGQHVGMGPSGVRAVHTINGQPTGIEACCSNYRSPHRNYKVALAMLESGCLEAGLELDA